MWVDGYTNTEFIDVPEKPLMRPYPLSIWVVDADVNEGFAYVPLFPDNVKLNVKPVQQRPYICVYDISTPQTEFNNNGLAILTPTNCEVSEMLNGEYAITMTHPIDPEGRYAYIIENNILKVKDKLFTIKSVEESYVGNTGSITCYAEAMWYQWGDGWCYPYQQILAKDGQAALDGILAITVQDISQGGMVYSFTGYSDMDFGDNLYAVYLDEGASPIELILGSGGLIERRGGELHRDNFYFSVNTRMEGARDNAFDIRIGKNLKGIKRTVDTTTFASYFRIYDEFGNWWACAWLMSDFLQRNFPHHVVRSKNISYGGDAPDYDRLAEDGMAFFVENCKPIIGYEIYMEDVRGNPDFEIIADESLRVGDIGNVYDDRLGGMITIEITGTRYDAVHDKITKLIIGDQQSFTRTALPPKSFAVQPQLIGGELWLQDASGAFMYDAGDNKMITEVSYG